MKGYYEPIGKISSHAVEELLGIMDQANWQKSAGKKTDYLAWTAAREAVNCIDAAAFKELTDLWPEDRWNEPWFVKVPPHGYLHRHSDGGTKTVRHHIPISTNPQCTSFLHDDEGDHEFHLTVGTVYQIDYSIEHSAVNEGETDRIHMIIDIRKE